VRPKVTLEAREPSSVDDNAIAHYPPGTTTIPVAGEVTPPHPGEKVIVRVQKIRPDGERILVAALKPKLGSEGAYSATFKEASSAKKYRLITWFQGDDDHEFATSNSVFVQVDP
jgi:hypothetical protein